MLDNTVITEVMSQTNIGLVTTNNLSWKLHISMVTDKAQKRLNVIARYKNILSQLALECLYVTMIHRVIEYANVIHDIAPQYAVQLVKKVQCRAALICCSTYRHTETQPLSHEMTWLPLSTCRKHHKLILFYKIYHHIILFNYIT